MNAPDTFRWLCDVYLLATILLAACGLASQPARRIALSWATTAGLVALALLCTVPGWQQWHLAPAAASAEVVHLHHSKNPTAITDATRPVESGLVPSAPVPLKVALAEPNARIDYAQTAVIVYVTGSLIVLGWLALGVLQVHRLLKRSQAAPPHVHELLSELIKNQSENPLPCTQGRGQGEGFPQVRTLANLPSAVAVGLFHPLILLPQSLVETTQSRQLRTVLAHELAHLEHRDLWLLAAIRGLLVLFWAHPLFWLWRRRVRLDQELLADTAAAELTSRADYAEELVAPARQTTLPRVPPLAASVGLWETRSQLAKRVAVLLNDKMTILRHCTRRWRIGSLVALVGLALGLSLVTLSPAERNTVSVNAMEESLHSTLDFDTSEAEAWKLVADGTSFDSPSTVDFDTSDSDTPRFRVQLNAQSGKPPELLYLAWQNKEPVDSDDWGTLTLWNSAGKIVSSVESQAFLARTGRSLSWPHRDDARHPLLLFFKVDENIDYPIGPTFITDERHEFGEGDARNSPHDSINCSTLVPGTDHLSDWPEKGTLKLRYATENPHIIKTVEGPLDQPYEIAPGVRCYLDPERAQEFDPVANRMILLRNKTVVVLELRIDPARVHTSYAIRTYLKGQIKPLREAYVTIVTRDGVNHDIRVTDAFDSPDQLDRVEILSWKMAEIDLKNVPIRIDLLPKHGKRPLRNSSAAYPGAATEGTPLPPGEAESPKPEGVFVPLHPPAR